MNTRQLIFVYNADSGIWNRTLNGMHKAFSPSTYSCHLCKITHGLFWERNKWTKFLKTLNISAEFYHRDEFIKKYHLQNELPAVFIFQEGKINLLITAAELKTYNLAGFQDAISNKLLMK